MSDQSRADEAKTDYLPADFLQLTAAIEALPIEHRHAIEPILSRVADSTKRRRRILTLVQDALSQLRLDMKYLMFDLEATRREREEYRQRLEHSEGDC